jgi:hypothetical protein
LSQSLVDLTKHLIGFDRPDPPIGITQSRLTQPMHSTDADSRLAARPEVDTESINRFMVQRGTQPLP